AREAENHVVRVRDEQLIDEILILDSSGGSSAAAAALRSISLGRLRLRVARVREGHDDLLVGDQVLHREVGVVLDDLGAALVRIEIADLGELVADDLLELLGARQDLKEFLNIVYQLTVFT